MNNKELGGTVPRWGFYSLIIIASFTVLQVLRWRILPQFMDIYYHLLTGWGFLQAGGWSGWDFWQYAPVGRVHIYPPFFHLALALLLKLGFTPVILAKFFETVTPILFLVVLGRFLAKNYSGRLAFFALLITASSFSFYMNLLNHIPAALAVVFCLFSLHYLLHKRYLSAGLFLGLSFYTHIGTSWFFAVAAMLWGLFFNKEDRRLCVASVSLGIILSGPLLLHQILNLKAISTIGLHLSEKQAIQIKPIEYLLACAGVFIALKMPPKFRLFPALFYASTLFLLYPYRLFSAEGYLPVILLSAVSLDYFYARIEQAKRYIGYAFIGVAAFIFLVASPTAAKNKFFLGHSAFMGMLRPMDEERGFLNSIWFERDYLAAADFIRHNSRKGDIIYSNYDIVGVCLASLSGHRTANALLPEIKPAQSFDPLAASGVAILSKDEEGSRLIPALTRRGFSKAREGRLFVFYLNSGQKNP